VPFKNLNDATLSSLGNPPNIQIKAAIMENPSFVNISVRALERKKMCWYETCFGPLYTLLLIESFSVL